MTATPLWILASTSAYRERLLKRLGLEFICVSPDVDEVIYKNQIKDPFNLSLKLAEAKAEAVFSRHPEHRIIGADQVAYCETRILSKAGGFDKALEQLEFLSGRWHELYTSVCVLSKEGRQTHTDITRLKMRSLSKKALTEYLHWDQAFDTAGSYKLECHGIALFEEIDSKDFTAIEGLPLLQLQSLIASHPANQQSNTIRRLCDS